jgi:hypothetical protein
MEMNSQRQSIDLQLPDKPAPHLQNEPNTTMSGSPPSNINVEIVGFPSQLAGAPITDSTHQQAHYEAYHTMMGDADNTYAPFCSKMDWEIAWWAKIHGPSSTAVSELLAINGVCLSCLLITLPLLTTYCVPAK